MVTIRRTLIFASPSHIEHPTRIHKSNAHVQNNIVQFITAEQNKKKPIATSKISSFLP